MTKQVRDALEAERRVRILNDMLSAKNISAEMQDVGIPNSTIYRWKASYEKEGKPGLFPKSQSPMATRDRSLRNMWRRSLS